MRSKDGTKGPNTNPGHALIVSLHTYLRRFYWVSIRRWKRLNVELPLLCLQKRLLGGTRELTSHQHTFFNVFLISEKVEKKNLPEGTLFFINAASSRRSSLQQHVKEKKKKKKKKKKNSPFYQTGTIQQQRLVMAKLWLMAVLLLLSASVGSSVDNQVNRPDKSSQPHFPRPDETQIAEIVNVLWKRYRPSYQSRFLNEWNEYPWRYPMFSLAVRIPYDNKMQRYDVSRVKDKAENVWRTIIGCDVYASKTMVAATVLKWPNVLDQCPYARVPREDVPNQCGSKRMTWAKLKKECPEAVRVRRADHAEYRVLNNFNTLKQNRNRNDFLLFYVLASPCDQKCASETSRFSILEKIHVITEWRNRAVVFSKVFKPKGGEEVPVGNLTGALKRLGEKVGLQNILRCDGSVPCTSCSSGEDVTRYCYDINEPKPAARDNPPSTSVNVPPGGNANAPSKTGQKKKNNNNNENPGGSTNVYKGGWQIAVQGRG
uniref:uncharacterized protein LOC120813714 n=1 Tax=Gasterosteus aculeatus aculeatus TaxID=481459 RepID=UPI001A9A014C|nr:uncharacterized protein LOC120813714 [Gasterosteus aculeatus aculeatus]